MARGRRTTGKQEADSRMQIRKLVSLVRPCRAVAVQCSLPTQPRAWSMLCMVHVQNVRTIATTTQNPDLLARTQVNHALLWLLNRLQYHPVRQAHFLPRFACFYIFASCSSIALSRNALLSPAGTSACNLCSTSALTCFFVTESRSTSDKTSLMAPMMASFDGPAG